MMLKTSLFSIVMFVSSLSLAESVHWEMGPVQGALEVKEPLVLESASGLMSCHYCSFSSCAGGPTDEQVLPGKIQSVGGGSYQMQVSGGDLNSRNIFKPLHSCSYTLNFSGTDSQSGKKVAGQVLLARSRGDNSNPIWEDESLSQKLSQDLLSEPLQLEVRIQGLAPPAIYEVPKNP